MKKGLWFVVALVAVYACGEATEFVGEGMRDAGQAMMDAGDVLNDAGEVMQPDAGAQPATGKLLSVPCDGERRTFAVSSGRQARVEVCGHAATGGGDCAFGGVFYTGNTIYLSCQPSQSLTFRLFD